MKLYLSIIFGTVAVLIAVFTPLAPFFEITYWWAVLTVLIFAFAVFMVNCYLGIFLRLPPIEIYAPRQLLFKTLKVEKTVYKTIKVRQWKMKVVDAGKLFGFHPKDKLAKISDPDYLYRFLCEMGYAEIVHIAAIIFGVVPFLLSFLLLPVWWHGAIFLAPIVAVNAFLNLLPIFVQRNNRPSMIRLYKRACRIRRRAEEAKALKAANAQANGVQ